MPPSPELVQRVPLFSELETRDLKKVAASLKERTFEDGAVITSEGSMGVGFFVIERGRARVTIEDRVVRTLGPGECFGELALILNATRSATVTAEGELHCYGMTHWDFYGVVTSNPSVAWKLLETLAQRLWDESR